MMAVPMTLLAGLLMFAGVQASDTADGSKFMAYHVNRAVDSRISSRTDFEIQKIADKEEDKDVQKLLNSESNMPIGLSAIGLACFHWQQWLEFVCGEQCSRQLPAAAGMELTCLHPWHQFLGTIPWTLSPNVQLLRSPTSRASFSMGAWL
jgi:hypothetical protein